MAIAKKKLDDILFEVNGLSIKKNSIYKIENRYDSNAPSGFQKERTTKVPSADIGNQVQCPFFVSNQATGSGVWNTGFYTTSPCYTGGDSKSNQEKVKALIDYVVTPYETYKSQDGLLSQSNDDFWSSYLIDLWDGRYLNTSNPEDMLDLYIAMLGGELAIESDQGNPKYKQADFIIIDKNKEKTNKQRQAVSNVTAIGEFYMLMSNNPQKLVAMLRYLGMVGVTDKVDQTTLMTTFNQWIDRHANNVELFQKLQEDMSNSKTEEVVYTYSTLRKAFDTQRIITKNGTGDYTYKGIPLGKDLKQVARNIITDPELADIKAQLLEECE